MHESFLPRPTPRARLAATGLALAAGGSLMAALFGLFHLASPTRWLEPTPELMELAASCQELPDRAGRLRCTQAVVAAYRDRHSRELHLAQSP